MASTSVHRPLGRALVLRTKYLFAQVARWGLLKAFGFGKATRNKSVADVALYSRFPALWERGKSLWQERMFGTWPQFLQTNGHNVLFAAVCTASPLTLVREWRTLKTICRKQNIWLLETKLSLVTLLRAHFTFGFFWHYLRWRGSLRKLPVRYAGLDITALFWRELDANALSNPHRATSAQSTCSRR